jgi:hypothetical protein
MPLLGPPCGFSVSRCTAQEAFGYTVSHMDPPDSPKTANSLGEFVRHALDVRQQWLAQHDNEADQDQDLREDWKDLKPFWKPWFRGHEVATWQLKPKLYRNANSKVGELFACEEELRAEFKRRGSQLAEGLTLPAYQDDWAWYSLMQHYGAPTRILDWSDGALTALYFAVRGTRKDDKKDNLLDAAPTHACVWMLDPYRLNRRSFYPPDDWNGVALPDWPAAKEYLPELFGGDELLREYPLAIDPLHVSRRLSSQRSHFTVFGTKLDGLAELAGENGKRKNPYLLEQITIPALAIPTIKSELELSGISEATIFPDLEALGRELQAVWESLFPPTSQN